MLTNNAANMKWVEHQKRDNTSAVTKQSVVNLISWVNSNALTKPKQAGKKAGTRASEPHTLSPKALGRHPVFRLGRVKKPDLFPGALGHGLLTWFHTQSWPERTARPISKQTSLDSWFGSRRTPCTLQPGIPSGKCAARFPHAVRAAYGYSHEAVCSLRTATSCSCCAQHRPGPALQRQALAEFMMTC